MRAGLVFAVLVTGIASQDALGEVTDAGPNGFSLVHELTINASRAEVWRRWA